MNAKTLEQREEPRLTDPYSSTYLAQYWPEQPGDAVVWADNVVLMLAYQDAAIAVQSHYNGKPARMLDISTGPALAPLLCMSTCVSEAQLSDFEPDNRRSIQFQSVDYWRNYVPMLNRIYHSPERHVSEILARLDQLRSALPPVEVNLFREPPFPQTIQPQSYDLISMNFVADGITKSEIEYLRCLGKVTDMVRPGGALIMSAVVDCQGWQLGPVMQPAPNVSEKTIVDFLSSQGIRILTLSRSIRHAEMAYSGGWIVLAAVRDEKV